MTHTERFSESLLKLWTNLGTTTIPVDWSKKSYRPMRSISRAQFRQVPPIVNGGSAVSIVPMVVSSAVKKISNHHLLTERALFQYMISRRFMLINDLHYSMILDFGGETVTFRSVDQSNMTNASTLLTVHNHYFAKVRLFEAKLLHEYFVIPNPQIFVDLLYLKSNANRIPIDIEMMDCEEQQLDEIFHKSLDESITEIGVCRDKDAPLFLVFSVNDDYTVTWHSFDMVKALAVL